MDKNKKKKSNKKLIVSTVAYSVLASMSAAAIIFAVLVYGFDIDNNLTRRIVDLMHFPAAIYGNNIITIEELDRKMDPIKKFYEKNPSSDGSHVDISTTDGKKMLKIKEKYLLNKIIENAIIEKEALRRGIEIAPETLSQEVSKELGQYGEESEIEKSLSRLYGWSVSDFEENIVKPELYKKKLLENFKVTDPSYEYSRGKIEEALAELKKGTDFKSVVKKYSEGTSVASEGDLGWFSAREMLPEISSVAFSLGEGKTGEIVESSLGYHIIKVEGRKNENGEDKVRLRQIFVKTKTIGDWLGEYQKTIKIYIPLRYLYWDEDEGRIDFSSGNLKKFEENMIKNPPEDISTMF